MDSHSYGFNLKKNYGFSLVDVVLFDALTYKVLAVPGQQYMEGVVTGSVGKKLKKNIEEISEDDVTHVVEKIVNMDRKTAEAICEELRFYGARKKYENRLKAAGNNK